MLSLKLNFVVFKLILLLPLVLHRVKVLGELVLESIVELLDVGFMLPAKLSLLLILVEVEVINLFLHFIGFQFLIRGSSQDILAHLLAPLLLIICLSSELLQLFELTNGMVAELQIFQLLKFFLDTFDVSLYFLNLIL